MRIANSSSDYTLIGCNDADGGTNTRIGIVGNTFGGENSGRINYMATSTGPHVFSTTDSGTERMRITSTGNVGIGTNNPKHMLHVSGILQVGDGTDATPITMQTGSLIIGSGTRNYGGSTTSWNTNTAGLIMECSENTEVVVHDSMTSLHSFMRYTTNGNFTIGRNMGHGVASVFKGNNGTAWDQTSDHRIKENVKKAKSYNLL